MVCGNVVSPNEDLHSDKINRLTCDLISCELVRSLINLPVKMKLFFVRILLSALLSSVLGQQCVHESDVVVTSPVALRKDLKALLDNLDVHVDGNISCSATCDGIERKIDSLTADIDGKLEELLNKTLNEVLDKKLYKMLDEILIARFNETERVGDGRFKEVLDEIVTLNEVLLDNITEQVRSLFSQTNRLHLHGRTPYHPAASCADVLRYFPDSPSGYYWIEGSGRQYCDMTRSCGGVTGGWMRVAYLDMTNSSRQCPSGYRQRTDSNKRTCVKNSDPAGCSSVTFSTTTSGYSKVCGKVIAYQVYSPDAFGHYGMLGSPGNINSHYVDGVSLTHGNPRRHLWTFAAALHEAGTNPHSFCPCTNTNTASQASQPPAFVGNDYFCDTAMQYYQHIFYGDDPLWDGAGCGPLSTCCSFNNPPWFYKLLPQPTTDDIEMRVCRDQAASDEDIAIEMVEIYIQ